MTRQKSLAQTKIHQESFEKPTTHVSYLPNLLIPKVHYMDIFSIYSTLNKINCKIVMIIICTQYLLVNTKVEKYVQAYMQRIVKVGHVADVPCYIKATSMQDFHDFCHHH